LSNERDGIIAEGKTKIVRVAPVMSGKVFIESKDDITAGDGKRRNAIDGKAEIATETTCNCFRLLNVVGIPTHFIGRINAYTFCASYADMIPVELVARRIATGSYLKRNPRIQEGDIFSEPVVEFFLKDDERNDPFMSWSSRKQCFELYSAGESYLTGYLGDLTEKINLVPESEIEIELLSELLVRTFLVLEDAWHAQGVTLVDMKIECGYIPSGPLVVADVIDNDSWRIWPLGEKKHMKDKQVYRNLKETTPKALEQIKKNYAWVAETTSKFVPKCEY